MKDKTSAAVEAVQPSPAPAVPAVPAQAIDETDTLQTTSIATQEVSTSSVAPSEAVVSTSSSAAETIERVRLRPGDRLSRLALKSMGIRPSGSTSTRRIEPSSRTPIISL